MNKKIALLLFSGVASLASAQTVREQILEKVNGNSPKLKAERMMVEASHSENRSGITLSDPQVELGMQNDFEADAKTLQWTVSQEFDLSVVLGKKRKAALAQSAVGDMEFLQTKSEADLETLQLLDQLVFLQKKSAMLADAVATNREIVRLSERSLQRGDCSKLDVSRARLDLADAMASFQSNASELHAAYLQLLASNGGAAVDTAGLAYDAAALPNDFEQWFASVADHLPEVQLATSQRSLCVAERKLSKADWLPKLSLSYEGERSSDENIHGVVLGLSVPLWENRNSVKAAKQKALAAEWQVEATRQAQHDALYQSYAQAKALEALSETYREALSELLASQQLMVKAVEAGEMSQTDYLSEKSAYYELLEKLLDAEFQFQQAKTSLMVYRMK